MKKFESFLKIKLEEYILWRKNLGYSDNLISKLRKFDSYVKEKGACMDRMQPSFFLDFREQLQGDPKSMNGIISAVRGLFEYLVRQGTITDNPLKYIPAFAERAFIPFIFSEEQTNQLVVAVEKQIRKTEKYFLEDLSATMAFVLLARCGLRISEPVRLLLSQYRPQEGTIYIEKTKFKKDRLIPIPMTVVTQLDNYLKTRRSLKSMEQIPLLLAGVKKKGVSKNKIYEIFNNAVTQIGLNQPKRIIGNVTFGSPTPHSLRHSFAVNTLRQIKKRGMDPQYALPVLATYMGHKKYRYTAVYLKVMDAETRNQLVDFNVSRKMQR